MHNSAPAARIWNRLMLHGTAFSGAYRKLKMLYAIEDPWDLASPREQHRFARTNAMLGAVAPYYDSILELGCGEGHQSVYLQSLTGRLYGIDLSKRAVTRARAHCPAANFAVAKLETAPKLFRGRRFDLITACEVLYYARDLATILPRLQARTARLFVSNYYPRSEQMRRHFAGPGWRPMSNIVHGQTLWECYLWEAAAAGA